MAQQTVSKINLQLSASAQALQQDLAKGSRDVSQFKEKVSKDLGKGFELKMDSFSKLGLMAAGGQILNDITRGNDALSETVSLTSQLALGWSVGGPIGAGIMGAVAGIRKFIEETKTGVAVFGKAGVLSTEQFGKFMKGEGIGDKAEFRADLGKLQPAAKAASELERQLKALKAPTQEESDLIKMLGAAMEGGGKRTQEMIGKVRSLYREIKLLAAQQDAAKQLEALDSTLQEQLDTWGMTATQVQLYKIGLSGVGDETRRAAIEFKALEVEKRKLQDATDGFLDNLRMEAMTFGMGAREAELFKLSLKGLSEEDRLRAQRLIAHVDGQKQWQEAMKAGKAVFEETRTPLERFYSRVAELQDLVRHGGIKDWDTYGRAVLGAWQQVAGLNSELMKVPELRSTPWSGAGSQQLFEREKQNRAENVEKRGNQNPVVQVLQKQLAIQQQQRQELQQLNQELRRNAGVDLFRL